MSKPGLGKGLGDLMNGDQVAGKESSAPRPKTESGSRAVGLGRGLNTLVATPPTGEASEKTKQGLPAWFFFAADILLLAYTVGITFDAAQSFDSGTMLFCAVSIGLGCVMGILGVLRVAK